MLHCFATLTVICAARYAAMPFAAALRYDAGITFQRRCRRRSAARICLLERDQSLRYFHDIARATRVIERAMLLMLEPFYAALIRYSYCFAMPAMMMPLPCCHAAAPLLMPPCYAMLAAMLPFILLFFFRYADAIAASAFRFAAAPCRCRCLFLSLSA